MKTSLIPGSIAGFGAYLIVRHAVGWHMSLHGKRKFEVPRSYLGRWNPEARAILCLDDSAFVASVFGTILVATVATVSVVCISAMAGIAVPLPILMALLALSPILAVAVRLERLEKRAIVARRTFSYALSSYLDLVSVLLAGGAGTETALIAAATTGDSWTFRVLRETLESARGTRTPSWTAFADLGTKLGIVDLQRVAGSMQLAGEQGSRVRLSLATQAEALRAKQISEIEATAQAATERMGVPTVLLFVGFIALLGYPALSLVLGQM